jgi:branched-chain amino acid transport system substrate-binding protein
MAQSRLAAAMVKVSFNAPRGSFRFDPQTHDPIQSVYILDQQQKGERIVGNVIATRGEVRAPATKQLWEAQ